MKISRKLNRKPKNEIELVELLASGLRALDSVGSDNDSKDFGGLEIYDQIEFIRLLDR